MAGPIACPKQGQLCTKLPGKCHKLFSSQMMGLLLFELIWVVTGAVFGEALKNRSPTPSVRRDVSQRPARSKDIAQFRENRI